MRRTHGLMAAAVLAVTGVLWSGWLRAQQDPPQDGVAAKAGEKLDEVGRAIRRGIENAEESVRDGINKTGATVREGFTKTRESVQGMGVLSRVYSRLHWDKSLHSSTLFVKAEAGAVTLRGSVPDETAKAKAVDLAKDTVGVTHVIDQLTVLSTGASTTTTTTIAPVRP
jgi:hyperosmotically inducible periplasmic protein